MWAGGNCGTQDVRVLRASHDEALEKQRDQAAGILAEMQRQLDRAKQEAALACANTERLNGMLRS
jgi:hypothetical protein